MSAILSGIHPQLQNISAQRWANEAMGQRKVGLFDRQVNLTLYIGILGARKVFYVLTSISCLWPGDSFLRPLPLGRSDIRGFDGQQNWRHTTSRYYDEWFRSWKVCSCRLVIEHWKNLGPTQMPCSLFYSTNHALRLPTLYVNQRQV